MSDQPLPFDSSAPRLGRDVARRAIVAAELPVDVQRAVLLVVSELVTNGVQHGRAPMSLVVLVADGMVHVAVSDGSASRPQPRQAPESAFRGRGLAIVAEAASAWGIEQRGSGKTVWADIATGHALRTEAPA